MATNRLCAISDCPRGVFSRGWCAAHYSRWYKTGDTKGSTLSPAVFEHGTNAGYQVHGCRCEDCADARQLRNYGISLREFQDLFARQGGVCAICGQPETASKGGRKPRLSIDHDHETGEIRGLLCNRCNTGLGLFLDDPDYLLTAIAYLRGEIHEQVA